MPVERPADETGDIRWAEVPSERLNGWCTLVGNMSCALTGRACNGACWEELQRREAKIP
jgi:hypothetical protein